MSEFKDIQTVLGFDFGTKHIGVAVGQSITKTARSLIALKADDGEPDWKEIKKLIVEWEPDALIVGRPLNMDGTEQLMTHKAADFAEKLFERFQLPVYLHDERLSTVEARSELFNQGGYRALKKSAIDAMAAQLILEAWLSEYC